MSTWSRLDLEVQQGNRWAALPKSIHVLMSFTFCIKKCSLMLVLHTPQKIRAFKISHVSACLCKIDVSDARKRTVSRNQLRSATIRVGNTRTAALVLKRSVVGITCLVQHLWYICNHWKLRYTRLVEFVDYSCEKNTEKPLPEIHLRLLILWPSKIKDDNNLVMTSLFRCAARDPLALGRKAWCSMRRVTGPCYPVQVSNANWLHHEEFLFIREQLNITWISWICHAVTLKKGKWKKNQCPQCPDQRGYRTFWQTKRYNRD